MYEVLAGRLSVGGDEEESALDHGIRCEEDAIAAFEEATGKIVETVGLCEHDEHPSIAYSPDGLISSKGKYTEDVEVKCLSSGKHVKAWLENKIPTEYHAQIVQAFVVNEDLETRYVVFYDPRITIHPLHIIEVHRKDVGGDIEDFKAQQIEFLAEVEEKLSQLINI